MADTYTQLYIHIIFAVKGRQSLIPKPHKDELHKYITGIIDSKNQTTILDVVARYIKNQEEHHSRQTFKEEYLAFLKRFNVSYNPKAHIKRKCKGKPSFFLKTRFLSSALSVCCTIS